MFYNFSSSLKNFYLELKSQHTTDGKYLAVITKNGLWIKDKIDNKILIINSSKIDQEYLIGNFDLATVYDKGDLRIEVGRDSDDFTRNLVTVLAEWRGLCIVKNNDRTAFVKGDFATDKAALETA